ncbi:MAG: hypothetical protein PHW66_09560 [Gallionella sp.]|nr:hypothetical protein [Gallionella sp.]
MDLSAEFPKTVSDYMMSDSRHRFILGPFGSGKSVGSQWEIPRRASMQRPSTIDGKRKTRFAVVRNTMPQLRDTTMKTFFDWFPNGTLGNYKETGKTYYIKQGDIECEVIFRALDDAADVKNLLSLELTGAYVNEFRDIHRDIIEALDGRVGRYPRMNEGGPSWVGIWGDSNMPEEQTYWWAMAEGMKPDDMKVKQPNDWEFFVQPAGAIRLLDGTYTENPAAENRENLPPGYYTNLITGKTDEYIRTYVMCEYGRSKGGKPVHPMFNRDVHVAKSVLIPNKQLLLLIGADFGRTPAMVLKQQDAFGRVLTLDNISTFGMAIETAIETKLLPLLRQKYDGFDIAVTGDPSGNAGGQAEEASCADIFRRYRRKGISKVKLAWSNSPVHRQGATDHFLSMLVQRGMPAYLIDPNCTDLIRALGGGYQFKKTKDGRNSEDVDKNDDSHLGEANEYADMWFHRGERTKADLKERGTTPTPPNVNPYATPR